MKLGSASNNTFFLRDSHDFAVGYSTMVFPLAAVSRTGGNISFANNLNLNEMKGKGDWAHTRFSCTFVIFVNSAAHSLSFGTIYPQQGSRYAHHLPVVCHSFGVWVTLSHQNRGYTTLRPCLWSVTPSEFGLLSPITAGVALRFTTCLWSCQPFGLAFFSRASYKEYDSPCSSD